jgi:hypothetical protein
VKRAGSAVELRPAPKARNAAHPQERQLSAAEGGRGTECARPELSIRGACAAPRQGSSPEWTETRVEMVAKLRRKCAAPGATRLETGLKGTRKKVCRSKYRSNFHFRTARSTEAIEIAGAPRSMKLGNIASPCPYDAVARHALQSANLRLPAILYYASMGSSLPKSRAFGYPVLADVPIHPGIDAMCQKRPVGRTLRSIAM